MKTYRTFGTAFAVLMCVNLASCSEDELPEYELDTSGKKLVKIEISNSYTGYSVRHLNYDNKGRLLNVIYDNGKNSREYDYVWRNNEINTYTLSDGLIVNWEYYADVTYNSDMRPVKIGSQSEYSFYYSFTWGTDRLSRRGSYIRQGNRTTIQDLLQFSYSEQASTCEGFNPIVPILLSDGFDGDFLCVAHPELVNARTTVLPNSFTLENFWLDDNGRLESETIRGTCNYKFDSDGYITECTMNENSTNYYAYKAKYTITWE